MKPGPGYITAIVSRQELYDLFNHERRARHGATAIVAFDNAGRFYRVGKVIIWHNFGIAYDHVFKSAVDADAFMSRLRRFGVQEMPQ